MNRLDDTPERIDVLACDLNAERDYWQRLADRFGRTLTDLGHHSVGTHQHPEAYDAESWYPCERQECLDAFRDRWQMLRTGTLSAADRYRTVCPGCDGTRWADDENWQPVIRGEKPRPGKGLIPCGFCNEGGWDAPWPGECPTCGFRGGAHAHIMSPVTASRTDAE